MVICGSMLLVAWLHVIRRYVFNNALTWSEEFLKFSLVWFSLLSASIIQKRKGHLGIIIFRERLPKKIKNLCVKSIPFLIVITTLIITIYGIILVINVQGRLTPALRIPLALPYASMPISFFLMTIYGINHILEDIKEGKIKK